MTVAGNERKLLARPAQNVLLDDFQRIFPNLCNNANVAVFGISKNKQVVSAWFVG